jgi:hypothetical protein
MEQAQKKNSPEDFTGLFVQVDYIIFWLGAGEP